MLVIPAVTWKWPPTLSISPLPLWSAGSTHHYPPSHTPHPIHHQFCWTHLFNISGIHLSLSISTATPCTRPLLPTEALHWLHWLHLSLPSPFSPKQPPRYSEFTGLIKSLDWLKSFRSSSVPKMSLWIKAVCLGIIIRPFISWLGGSQILLYIEIWEALQFQMPQHSPYQVSHNIGGGSQSSAVF